MRPAKNLPLTVDQQEELKNILATPGVEKIITDAQFCLYILDLKLSMISHKITPLIKKHLLKEEKLKISKGLSANLERIILQILQALSAQKDHFFSLFGISLLMPHYQQILESKNQTQEINRIMLSRLRESLDYVGIEITTQRKIDPSFRTDWLDEYFSLVYLYPRLINKVPNMFYNITGIITLSTPVYNLVQECYSGTPYLTGYPVQNFLAFAMGVRMLSLKTRALSWGSLLSNGISSRDINELKETQPPKYSLELIRVVDFKNPEINYKTYLPVWTDAKQNSETKSSDDKSDDKRSDKPKSKSRYIPNFIFDFIPTTLSSRPHNPSWLGEQVICGEEGKIIPATEIHRLSFPFSKTIYYGFFNRAALKKQGIDEKSSEWKNYQARIEHGHVVSSSGETGIKQLKPPILSNLRIGSDNFGYKLFPFSAKTIGTIYRLLGPVSAIQMNQDGIQHKLVDFCFHLPRGPGH